MVLKRMMAALGVGGPSVDTVLADPNVRPGQVLTGEVRIMGGEQDVEIEHVALGLMTRVEVEGGDNDYNANVEFHRGAVAGRFRLPAKTPHTVPFQMPVPWETPVTHVQGQHLRGMTLGVRTELAIARAVDKGDMDPINVHPLPSQERVLQAFQQLGCGFRSADLERGVIQGARQALPFYQEIEFFPPQNYAGRIKEIELTFIADPQGLLVVLEADKRGGLFQAGGDAYGRFHLSHEEALQADWAAHLNSWLAQVSQRGYPGAHGMSGHHGMPGRHGMSGHHGHRGHGLGVGEMATGAAAGFLGGMLAGEALEQIGDTFFGED
ncbi:MAG: sporulation-control protein [Actinomycetota bacterium]|nr:sporulation-control protein [Actinomycetota bacterium]